MYAIKTVDNKIAKDIQTGQLEIYETFDYAYKAICRELDTVVEIEYFKTKEGAKRDLEQQVKSLSEFAESLLFRGCLENTFERHDVLERIKEIKGGAE